MCVIYLPMLPNYFYYLFFFYTNIICYLQNSLVFNTMLASWQQHSDLSCHDRYSIHGLLKEFDIDGYTSVCTMYASVY